MECNICGLIDINTFNKFKIIDTIDVLDNVNIYIDSSTDTSKYYSCKIENNYTNNKVNKIVNKIENVNINKNNFNYKNNIINNSNSSMSNAHLNQDLDLEFINVNIDILDININKQSNINTCIYFIKFVYILDIIFTCNSKLDSIKIKNLYSYSFIYNDLDLSCLSVHPINFNLHTLENNFYYSLNLAIVDENIHNDDIFIIESSSNEIGLEDIKNKTYSYINELEEFI